MPLRLDFGDGVRYFRPYPNYTYGRMPTFVVLVHGQVVLAVREPLLGARGAVNLDGWSLADEDGHFYTFRHVRLDGRSTVRVHTGIGRDTRTDLFQDRRAYVWNNDHDTATPRNDHGRFVDEISWGHRGHRH